MAKEPKSKATRHLPWQTSAVSPEVDLAISRLTSTLHEKKTRKDNKVKIDPKDSQKLEADFKNAGQARGSAHKFMIQISREIGSAIPNGRCSVASMKDWNTAAEKFSRASHSLTDLGRGRILLGDVDEYRELLKLVKNKKNNGHLNIPGGGKITIIDGSLSDYIANPRRSGYAGSVNFDVQIEHGKGRSGRFEIQAMPSDYEDVYDHSHHLYDMIRIYDGMPESYLRDEDRLIKNVLIMANSALFSEHSARSGFDAITQFKNLKISHSDLQIANAILDKVRNSIKDIPGRNYKWKQDTLEAITYAKSSLMNVYLGQPKAARNSTPHLIIG